nr:uncharacterized protein LOC112131506 [Pongo abelii]
MESDLPKEDLPLPDSVRTAASLLGLPEDVLLETVQVRTIRAGRRQQVFQKPCPRAECDTHRDCLAKLIYARCWGRARGERVGRDVPVFSRKEVHPRAGASFLSLFLASLLHLGVSAQITQDQCVETELKLISGDILDVLDKHLIPAANTGKSKVFYYEMLLIILQEALVAPITCLYVTDRRFLSSAVSSTSIPANFFIDSTISIREKQNLYTCRISTTWMLPKGFLPVSSGAVTSRPPWTGAH